MQTVQRSARLCFSLRRAFSIDVSRLRVDLTTSPKPRTEQSKLVFGKTTTDHMLEIDWTKEEGWSAPRISPYHNFSLDPACSVFHYAIEGFEGMKAFRGADGRVRLFRPDMNMARLGRTMRALSLPALDERGFQDAIARLVKVDSSWIPEGDGFSLYIRPTVIGTQPSLGVGPSSSLKLFAILCPVGPYYPEGFKPVRLLAERDAVRAWPGGIGDMKVGGNYAPTIKTQVAAAARGYAQVLWLVGKEQTVTEAGTMNFFVLWRTRAGRVELVTAPLDGTILPGVTRDSMMTLARAWGEFDVVERTFTMPELAAAIKEGRVLEAFGAGTAAVVAPVKQLHYDGVDYDIPVDAAVGAGPVAKRLWKELGDIQYGRVASKWSVLVE